ncbi:MAG: hypothetical protein ABIH34_00885 [Nanoarchaeota archaeon]
MVNRQGHIDIIANRMTKSFGDGTLGLQVVKQALALDRTQLEGLLGREEQNSAIEQDLSTLVSLQSHWQELNGETNGAGLIRKDEHIHAYARRRVHDDLDLMYTRFNPHIFALTAFFAGWKYRHITRKIQVMEEEPGTLKTLRRLSHSAPLITSSDHQSNLDQVVLGWALYMNRIPMPLFQAGINLALGKTRRKLPALGAYFIDKGRLGTLDGGRPDLLYIRTRSEMRKHMWDMNINQHHYSQAGRSYTGEFPGQHYLTGKEMIDVSLISDAMAFQKETGKKVWVGMISLANSLVAEGESLYAHALEKKSVPSTDMMAEWAQTSAHLGDYGRKELPITLYVHRPRLLDELAKESDHPQSSRDVTRHILEEIGRHRTVLPVPLLSLAVETYREQMEGISGNQHPSYATLRTVFTDLRNALGKHHAVLHSSLSAQEHVAPAKIDDAFFSALLTHEKLGSLQIVSTCYDKSRLYWHVRPTDSYILPFMANTLRHLKR